MGRKGLDFSWRPGVPSRRSAVGALLITVAAVVAFTTAGAADAPEPALWLAADRDLRQGQPIQSSDLRAVPLDAPAVVIDHLVSAEHDVEGEILLGPLAEGQLLAASAMRGGVGGTDGHEVTIEVPAAQALGGDLQAGETVEILATDSSGPEAETTVAASAALVLALSDIDNAGLSGSWDQQVTLSLPDADSVLATTHAAMVSDLTFVRSPTSAESLTGEEEPQR